MTPALITCIGFFVSLEKDIDMAFSSSSGCSQIYCQPQDYFDPGSLYVAASPSGSGGIALNNNFYILQYRQPKCSYSQQDDPEPINDGSPGEDYCVGSRWLNVGIDTRGSGQPYDKMWICVDNRFSEAIWVPWLRWQFPDSWQD
jgi:hypothetical protein